MIDLVKINIPLGSELVHIFKHGDDGVNSEADFEKCHALGCKLMSGEVDISDTGTNLRQLRHPYESLPSSNGSLSFKIFKGSSISWPYLEMKASPAKLLQGHNVFGPDDAELCILSLLDSFAFEMPELSKRLSWDMATIRCIDCTYSARFDEPGLGPQLISVLRNTSARQIRPSNRFYESTVNWNESSRHVMLKAYLKHPELSMQIAELEKRLRNDSQEFLKRQLTAMKSEQVQTFAKTALRLEASIRYRKLKTLGVPVNLLEFIEYAKSKKQAGENLIQELWTSSFSPLLETFRGTTVNIYDDEKVHKKLRETLFTITSTGKLSYAKADRLFRLFRSIKNEGFDEVKRTTPPRTFSRNIGELTAVVPKAYLQSLDTVSSNVVPLVRVIDVDFAKQFPDDYVEPKSMVEQLTGNVLPLKTG